MSRPEDIELARRVLRDAQRQVLDRLVGFVVENEGEILATTRQDFDASGTMDRLHALHQEIYVLGGLLGALPQPAAAPAPAPKPPA